MKKPHVFGRPGLMVLTVAAALLLGAFALPMAIGTGPFAPDVTREQLEPPAEVVPASETMKISPPLDLDNRLPLDALSEAERAAASAIPSAVGVVARTAAELPIDDGGLGFGELRVLLESGGLVRMSWQRWDPTWDFEEFAGINPKAKRIDRADGDVALYTGAGATRRSITLWTGELLVTVSVRSTVNGEPPTTGFDEVERWVVDFANRLAETGF